MNAIIFFSLSKKRNAEEIALSIEGDHYEIIPDQKIVRWKLLQILYYGYLTMKNRPVKIIDPNVDFSKYEHIYFVFPIWAGRPAIFMAKYIEGVQLRNKKVSLIATSDSGKKDYESNLLKHIDRSNEIINISTYKKTTKV